MLNIYFTILFTLLMNTNFEQSIIQCERIWEGTFISSDKITGITTIQRKNNIQLEENKTLGVKYFEKITWLNDCSYEINDVIVIQNDKNITIPFGNIVVTFEVLNDSVFNQTVFIEEHNYKYSSNITKTSNNVSDDFTTLIKLYGTNW